jgi:hypothetical protein
MITAQVPDGPRIELLRSAPHPSLEQGGDKHQSAFGLAEMRVQSGERDRCLSGVFGFAANRGHQPRSTGDRLTPGFRIRQTDKQTPPVVDERYSTSRELATMQVTGGETTPAPLVLQFVSSRPKDRSGLLLAAATWRNLSCLIA